MPRPINKEQRAMRRLVLLGVLSVGGLILIAQLMLLLVPEGKYDVCLAETLAMMNQCIEDIYHGHRQ